MAATCPAGHASASDDYCEVCGTPIGAAPSLTLSGGGAAPPEPAQASGTGGSATVPGGQCPRCGAVRMGNFCESCGYDFASLDPVTLDPAVFRSAPPLTGPLQSVPVVRARPVPAPPTRAQPPVQAAPPPVPLPPTLQAEQPAAGGAWAAVVSADRDYYDEIQSLGGPDAAGIVFPAYVPQRRFPLTAEEVRIGRHSTTSGIDPEIDLSVPPADPGVSRLHAVLLRSPDGSYSVVDPGSANGTAVNGTEIPQGQAVPLREGDRIHLGAWTELRVVRDA